MKSAGSTLEQLLGKEEAKVAAKLIAAAVDDAARAVTGLIKAHHTVWMGKDEKERAKLIVQAEVWAARNTGHVVACPACKSNAVALGDPIAPPNKTINGDLITETQQFLPSKFGCLACRMKISGFSQLNACDLGDAYKKTSTYDAASYYAPEDEYEGYEDDNNEPV